MSRRCCRPPSVQYVFITVFCDSSEDSGDDSEAYIKPAKKTKPTAQPSMTDFFEKQPAASKTAAKPASRTRTKVTARKASGSTKAQPPPKKPPAKKAAESSEDEILMDDPESSAPVAPRGTAPRRAAATKTAYIELSDDDDDD